MSYGQKQCCSIQHSFHLRPLTTCVTPDKSDNRTSTGPVLHLSEKRVYQEFRRRLLPLAVGPILKSVPNSTDSHDEVDYGHIKRCWMICLAVLTEVGDGAERCGHLRGNDRLLHGGHDRGPAYQLEATAQRSDSGVRCEDPGTRADRRAEWNGDWNAGDERNGQRQFTARAFKTAVNCKSSRGACSRFD